MPILDERASWLQTILGTTLDQIGRDTRAIRRRRKFSGSSLSRTVVLTLMKSPKPITDDFVATAAQLGVQVTPQAIERRFSGRLVALLRAAFERVLAHRIAAASVPIPLLEKFTRVEIGDSTTITLPDDYEDEFPGCGGKVGQGKAAVKLQFQFDLRTGKPTKCDFHPGRHSDAKAEEIDESVAPGSLTIRDLGYFRLKRFQGIDEQRAYWISRWSQDTAIFDEGGRPLDLLDFARRRAGDGPIDMSVSLGAEGRMKCLLIVLRVPAEMAARRRQKAHDRARKHGRVPTREHLDLCEWTIFVTNCPPELLTWKEVVVLYRSRWEIELIFKLWKSHNQLASYRANWTSVERMVMSWGKLIGVLLQHGLLVRSIWHEPRRSLWKAARIVRRWIESLTASLGAADHLEQTLEAMTATIRAVAKQKLQSKRPSSFQLLLNPELLDWNR